MLIAEMKQNRPQDAEGVEKVVDHLLTLPAMQAPDAYEKFMESYRQSIAERNARGISA